MRTRRFVTALGFAVMLTAISVVPATATPNNQVDIIRGQGSDTTIDLMRNLSRAFNVSKGCNVLTVPQRLDHVCGVSGPPFNDPNDATIYENWDHDVALDFDALGSGNGINMLQRFGQPGIAKIDFARSSRARSGSDDPGLRFVAFAKDALAPVDFQGTVDPTTCDVDRTGGPSTEFPEFDDSGPTAPVTANDGRWPDGSDTDTCNDATVATSVTNVTSQQVKDVYINCGGPDSPSDTDADGKMTWKDLDSTKPAVPIIVWTSQVGSGTRSSWDGFIGGQSDTCLPTAFKNASLSDGNRVIFEHDATPIVNCATDDDGAGPEGIDCPDENGGDGFSVHYTQSIYHYGVGAFSVSGTEPQGQGSDLLSVNGKAATPANIKSGQFLYSRDVFNVYRNTVASGNNATDAIKDFVGEYGWICKPAAKHIANPKTGINYATEIDNIISATGFVPLDDAVDDNGINTGCRVS